MCLIAFAYHCHPRYRLIVAANRDEFYRRPTAPAGFWPECPQLLAGRDLEQGGTWLGITRGGRFAALTNYRDPTAHKANARSRGGLVRDFLCDGQEPEVYLRQAFAAGREYNGFNLLIGEGDKLWYWSNRGAAPAEVTPGIHGLSNHLLNTPWPKVAKAKDGMAACLTGPDEALPARLFALLADDASAPDAALPDTGVGLEWERTLSPIFIASPDYGTRSSTVILAGYDGQVWFCEKSWPGGAERVFAFSVAGS